MPFAEDGHQLDEATRRRLNEIMGLVPPSPSDETVLGFKVDEIRKQLETERALCRDDEPVTREDILRWAYTERYV